MKPITALNVVSARRPILQSVLDALNEGRISEAGGGERSKRKQIDEQGAGNRFADGEFRDGEEGARRGAAAEFESGGRLFRPESDTEGRSGEFGHAYCRAPGSGDRLLADEWNRAAVVAIRRGGFTNK